MAKDKGENKDAIFHPEGGTDFPSGADPKIDPTRRTEIVATLQGYFKEADENRKSGMNPRDQKWQDNLDLYWNRWDFKSKANWQAKESMPEVPAFVDRFAAAMKEALIQTPEGFYTVSDPGDTENDLTQSVKRVMDTWLTTVGRNQVGQLLPMSAVFEEQMKMGALMATSSVTTWKTDVPGGRVAIETVDPRNVWLDHTYRNLYRIRRVELDRHELGSMKTMMDGKGSPIFNIDEIANMETGLEQALNEMQRTGGGASQAVSARKPIILDEYIATVVGNDGTVIADRSLIVLANQNYIIRGPEANPFWHGKDWLTYAPLVTAPLSVYGRSYMEDFGGVAKTFNELTNMILDAVHTTSLKAYAVVPGMLLNPNQVAEGISPNKMFLLDDGYRAEDFAKALDLGTLPPEAVKVWESMKSELANAAGINEIGLGQFAPNSRTSATEINETQQSSSALIRSVAQTVETRWLDPALDLVWKTGMQHVTRNSEPQWAAAGDDLWPVLLQRRKELIKRPITFQARGISMLIARSQQLKSLLGILSVIGQNDVLMQEFLKKVDIGKLVDRIFLLSGIDMSKFTMGKREQMVKDLTSGIQQAGQNAAGAPAPSPQGQDQVASAVSALGVGR